MKQPVFRKYSASLAKARTLIGSGVMLNYRTTNGRGTLTLKLNCLPYLADDLRTTLTTGYGKISLTNASQLFSLWGSAPVALSARAKHWSWLYFNMDKSQTINEVFGSIEPANDEAIQDAVHCSIVAELEDQRVEASVIIGSENMIQLLSSSHWKPLPGVIFPDLTIKTPVIVAETELSFSAVSKLQPGDIIMPERSFFDTDGLGLVTIGNRRWKAQAHTDNTPPYYKIITSDVL